MGEKINLSNDMDKEIIERINKMESASYDHGPCLKRADFIGIATLGIICIAGLIWGVY
ncbi:hypothetical protein WMZ97_00820 [Lentibacillus sp. N15]|uniref:hypothetical protein n=1 Tax=Lentibacillus songyuanensis TaxID=3136161 RepID=UPI0031BB04C4